MSALLHPRWGQLSLAIAGSNCSAHWSFLRKAAQTCQYMLQIAKRYNIFSEQFMKISYCFDFFYDCQWRQKTTKSMVPIGSTKAVNLKWKTLEMLEFFLKDTKILGVKAIAFSYLKWLLSQIRAMIMKRLEDIWHCEKLDEEIDIADTFNKAS